MAIRYKTGFGSLRSESHAIAQLMQGRANAWFDRALSIKRTPTMERAAGLVGIDATPRTLEQAARDVYHGRARYTLQQLPWDSFLDSDVA